MTITFRIDLHETIRALTLLQFLGYKKTPGRGSTDSSKYKILKFPEEF